MVKKFDLQERLLEFSVEIIRTSESLLNTPAGRHVAGQLLHSGTASYGIHGEAEDAESPADFIHKMKLCLKELRETHRWLRLVERVPLARHPEDVSPVLQEADQLIRIFRKSILTAKKNQQTTS